MDAVRTGDRPRSLGFARLLPGVATSWASGRGRVFDGLLVAAAGLRRTGSDSELPSSSSELSPSSSDEAARCEGRFFIGGILL